MPAVTMIVSTVGALSVCDSPVDAGAAGAPAPAAADVESTAAKDAPAAAEVR